MNIGEIKAYLKYGRFLLLALSIFAAALPGVAAAQDPQTGGSKDEPPSVKPSSDEEPTPGRIIVKFEEDAGSSTQTGIRRQEGLQKNKDLDLIDAEVDEVEGRPVEEAIRDLESRPGVEYATLDRKVYPTGYADEPRFAELWGLDNTGQTINGSPGVPDVDMNAKEASTITRGDSNLVVAVIDDGVDFSHPDLAGRAWKNPGESGSGKETNGIDDDGNGHVDDVNGWDFFNDDASVHDADDHHGTHVSGTIAASVNGEGVAGVAPNVKIMALKFLGPEGGYLSEAIDAIGYATSEGARISNNSWGYAGPPDPALRDAIESSGQLFVAAAGNHGRDNDADPSNAHYPASYDSPSVLSVAAIDNGGSLAGFSGYGATTVDISAPGVGVLSSIPEVPEQPALALSSVGSSGKAITAGFGADEIGAGDKRASFVQKAFEAVGHTDHDIVLVDDDLNGSGYPDIGSVLSTAIESATGSAPEVVEVARGADGPALSELSGKTVVWATGQAYFSERDGRVTKTTLTPTDQQTLTDFLDGGGRLVLTGMDALWKIETSPFVAGALKLNAQSDVPGKKSFEGVSGTAFAGEAYALDSPTANANYHDVLTPSGTAAVTQGVYPGVLWAYLNGTSMATPHATGAAALAASLDSRLLNDPEKLKKLLMDSGKPVPNTAGKTVTGKMVDAHAAVLAVDTTAPTVTSVSPAAGATSVAATTEVEAVFSEVMDPSTLDDATFTLLENSATTPVAAEVGYDNASGMAALNPNAGLASGATYTARVKGGANGAKDTSGNELADDKVWSFTVADTAAPGGAVLINDGARRTRKAVVRLALSAADPEPGSGVESMRFSSDGVTWSEWETYATSKTWTLSRGRGIKTVYIEFRDEAGNISEVATDAIKKK